MSFIMRAVRKINPCVVANALYVQKLGLIPGISGLLSIYEEQPLSTEPGVTPNHY